MIIFDFNEKKATQVAALLLSLNCNKMNYTKLIKLLYLIDRESLKRFNKTVSGDVYCSLNNGPILSRVYDLIKYDEVINEIGKYWHKFIFKDRYDVELQKAPKIDELSEREEKLIIEIDKQFKNFSYAKMIDYCHTLPEWKDPDKVGVKSLDLTVEDILERINKSRSEIKMIREDANLSNFVNSNFI